MKYCHHCHRVTTGEPLFCNSCGRSYDYKLCPHRHPNPRTAEVCSQCGSRELSAPHPRVPLWLSPLLVLLSGLPGIALLAITVLLLIGLLNTLLTNQQLLFEFMMLGLMVGFLWWMYMHLPGFLRRAITKLLLRRKEGNDHHEH
jgi:hypothetical protein